MMKVEHFCTVPVEELAEALRHMPAIDLAERLLCLADDYCGVGTAIHLMIATS